MLDFSDSLATLFRSGRRRTAAAAVVGLAAASLASAGLPDPEEVWLRVDTANFTLIGNAPKERVVRFGTKLEGLREVLRLTSPGMSVEYPLPTTIYVFEDGDSFAPYRSDPPGDGPVQAGYFAGARDGNYVAIDASGGALPHSLIYHEYLHFFLNNNVPRVPLWLNEGMAELYGTFVLDMELAEVGRPPRQHLSWLREHPVGSIEELLEAEDYAHGDGSDSARSFYAHSWLLTHYLVAGSDTLRERLSILFGELNLGASPRAAFVKAYGDSFDSLQESLNKYGKRPSGDFRYYTVKLAEELVQATPKVRELERVEVLSMLGDLLAHLGDYRHAAAEEYLKAALELKPDDARAISALGYVRYRQDRHDEAAELFEKAIAADPERIGAYGVLADSLLFAFDESYDGVTLADTTPEPVAKAREYYRKSMELTGERPDDLAGFGRTFLFEKGDVSEGASALARAATDLPERPDVLCDAIILTARGGNLAAALNLLEQGLRPTGEAGLVHRAEQGIANHLSAVAQTHVEKGDFAEAKAMLDEAVGSLAVPEVVEFLTRTRDQVDFIDRDHRAVTAYNAAVKASRTGQLEKVDSLLAEVMALDPRDELKEAVASLSAQVGGQLKQLELVERFQDAKRMAETIEWKKAIPLLEEILASNPPDTVKGDAVELLESLRRAAAGS